MVRGGLLLVLVLAGGAALPAQERRAAELRQRSESLPRDGVDWFRTQAELVEALFDVDVQAARVVAEEAWRVAEAATVPGAAETMAAFVELAIGKLEGPVSMAEWTARASAPPATTAPILIGHHHLARARSLCKGGDHAEELRLAIAGQTAAEPTGDPVLQLELALHTVHATPLRTLARLRGLLEKGLDGPRARDVAALQPWVTLQAYVDAGSRDELDEAGHLLDEAEKAATADGNRRVLATVLGYRVSRFVDRNDPCPDAATARTMIDRAVAMFAAIGDRRDLAVALGVEARVAMRDGDWARADEILGRAAALLKDRGLHEPEDQLRHVRFDLAVRRGDGDRAAELVAELEQRAAHAASAARDLRRVREELERADKAHANAEGLLRFAAQLAEERAQRTRLWAGAGAIVAFAAIAALAWRSRRRLLAVNRQLAEQVDRAEAATAARSAIEERMRQLERTQSLGAIAAGVAHDFNNLLTGIVGNAELITMLGRNEDVAELARRIVVGGKQAARMCHQMQQCALDVPTQAEAMDLLRLFHDMLPVLRASVGEGVEIVVATVADRLCAVVDRSQLEQVLLNLVVNARDAKATRIVLRTAAAPSDGADRGRLVAIEVADNGEGMAADVAQRIFDPFFTTRFPGRGLGLAVASSIVARHGGSIDVHSERGRGTTFTILLPAATAVATKEPSVVLPSAPPMPRDLDAEMLVIDDDEGVRRVLTGMLRSCGAAPMEFSDGERALEALAAAPTTRRIVIFVDLTMPGLDGEEVVRRARAVRPDARIVLMSGHAGAHVGHVARDVDPDAVLAKPFSFERLRNLLATLDTPSDPASRA